MEYNYEIFFRAKGSYDNCTSIKDIFKRIKKEKKYFKKVKNLLKDYDNVYIHIEDDYGYITFSSTKPIPTDILNKYGIDIVEEDE